VRPCASVSTSHIGTDVRVRVCKVKPLPAKKVIGLKQQIYTYTRHGGDSSTRFSLAADAEPS
jgi:hypothetical protein